MKDHLRSSPPLELQMLRLAPTVSKDDESAVLGLADCNSGLGGSGGGASSSDSCCDVFVRASLCPDGVVDADTDVDASHGKRLGRIWENKARPFRRLFLNGVIPSMELNHVVIL